MAPRLHQKIVINFIDIYSGFGLLHRGVAGNGLMLGEVALRKCLSGGSALAAKLQVLGARKAHF